MSSSLSTTNGKVPKRTGPEPTDTPVSRPWRGAAQDVGWTLVLTAAFLAVLVGSSLEKLGNPFRAGGDPLSVGAAGSSLDLTSHAVGYPFGMTLLPYFPTLDFIQVAMADAVSLFTDSPYLPGNIVWLVSYPLTAVAAWWVFRLVGARRPTAVALAVSFAFIPYHSVRALTHLYLATTWSAVLAVGLALLVGLNRISPPGGAPGWGQRRFHAAVVLVAVVVAFSGIYFAFFALLLITMALIWRFAKGTNLRDLLIASYPAVVVCCVMLTGLVLQAVARAGNPPVAPVVSRNAGDSAIFAGNLSMALTPSPKSDVPMIDWLTQRSSEYLYENEGFTYGQFGSVVSSGCAVIFLVGTLLFARSSARGRRSEVTLSHEDEQIAGSGLILGLVTGTALFFGPWSLNFLFALFVTPGIRSWNRLLPVILLLLMCGAVVGARQAWRPSRVPAGLIAALILVLTMFDGVTPYRPMIGTALSRSAETVQAARYYAQSVNAITPERCGVLQLPYVPFPESPPPGRMEDYQHFLVGLANPEKYWSYGGVKRTTASVWAERLQDDIDEAALGVLREAGFCGIHVDRYGYAKGEVDTVVGRLEATLGRPMATGSAGRWVYFTIEGWEPRDPESFDLDRLSPAAQQFFAPS